MSKQNRTFTECSSVDGITVGLIDTIINAGHLLAQRDLRPEVVFEAISDLRSQRTLAKLFAEPQKEWRVVYTDGRLTYDCLFRVELEARIFAGGGVCGGVSLLGTWAGLKKTVRLQCRDFESVGSEWRDVDFEIPPHNTELIKFQSQSGS